MRWSIPRRHHRHAECEPSDLVHFLDGPRAIRSLPNKRMGGHAKVRWTEVVSDAEARGLLMSPGPGPHWELTAMGLHVAYEWLRKGAAA